MQLFEIGQKWTQKVEHFLSEHFTKIFWQKLKIYQHKYAIIFHFLVNCSQSSLASNFYQIFRRLFFLFLYANTKMCPPQQFSPHMSPLWDRCSNRIFLHDLGQHFYTKCALQKFFSKMSPKHVDRYGVFLSQIFDVFS